MTQTNLEEITLTELRQLPKNKLYDFTYMVCKEKKVLLSCFTRIKPLDTTVAHRQCTRGEFRTEKNRKYSELWTLVPS